MKAARVAVATLLLLLLAFVAPAAGATKAELRQENAALRDRVRCMDQRFGHYAGLEAIYWRATYNYSAAISDVLIRDEPVGSLGPVLTETSAYVNAGLNRLGMDPGRCPEVPS